MPLSDDLNRTRLKRQIDELHVDVRRLQNPQERHQALKELDQLTVEYIRALCTEMRYVFQQSALLQEELQPNPEPALAKADLLEPLMLQIFQLQIALQVAKTSQFSPGPFLSHHHLRSYLVQKVCLFPFIN